MILTYFIATFFSANNIFFIFMWVGLPTMQMHKLSSFRKVATFSHSFPYSLLLLFLVEGIKIVKME